MIRILIFTLLTVNLFINCSFADEIEDLLQKALDAKNSEVGNDSSARQRYLSEILEKNPDHVEALWQMALIKINTLSNYSRKQKAIYLAALGPEINNILTITKSNGDMAFYHYVNALYASEHYAFDTALSEIEKSISLEPNTVRYLLNKGQILIDKGKWRYNDGDLEEGIAIIEAAHTLSQKHQNPFHSSWHYNFLQALAYSDFEKPRWKEVIDNYLKSIDIMEKVNATEKSSYAYAWNNMSKAYRKSGHCQQALKSAEKALTIMKFGAAKNNKRAAELCIEMQQMIDGETVKSN